MWDEKSGIGFHLQSQIEAKEKRAPTTQDTGNQQGTIPGTA